MNILLLVGFLLSVGFLAAAGLGEALSSAWARVERRDGLHPWALSAPRIVGALPLAGLTFAALALLPSRPWIWLTGRCACEAWGGSHLCPLHLAEVWPVVAASVLLASVVFGCKVRALLALAQRTRDLEYIVSVSADDEVALIEAGGRPTVFVAGLRRPRLFADRRWWFDLTERERVVITAHEHAHIERDEPRVFTLLDALLVLFAPRARRVITEDWLLVCEVRADADAAKADGERLYVAELLCRYARTAAPHGALGLGGRALEARVRALLDGTLPRPVVVGPVARAGGLVGLVGAGHGAHRLFELLLASLA